MTGVERFDWRDCVGQYRLYYLVRSTHLLATLLCVLIVVAWFVNVAYFAELAGLYDEASAEGKDKLGAGMIDKIKASLEKLNRVVGITLILEAASATIRISTRQFSLLSTEGLLRQPHA